MKSRLAAGIVAVVMLVQVVTHLAWLPISTQVGQMAIPWLMSRGMTMFGNILENRPPTEAALIALLMRLLPAVEPILIVRALNLLLVLALTVIIFLLAKRLTGSLKAALLAVLFWALWEPVYGNLLFYFDAVVGLLLVLTALVGLNARRAPQIALCGLLLGLATVIKQPAWAGVILFGLWLIAGRRWRDLAPLMAGVVVFPLLTVLIIALQGNLQTYLFWNFERYLVHSPGGAALTGEFVRKLILTDILVPVFILLALRQQRREGWLIISLWLAAGADMLPNFSEIYVMAHLPLLSVMSGAVLARALPTCWRGWFRQADTAQIALAGVALAIGLGWAWIVLTPYIPGPLGRARIPAYDEFRPVAERVNALKQPGDTLYVLPMLDGNPQLYPLTGLLPPGLWVTSNSVFLAVPGITDQLLAEWNSQAPDIVVDFPDLDVENPWAKPLIDFVHAHYRALERVEAVPFNGTAVIYRLNASS